MIKVHLVKDIGNILLGISPLAVVSLNGYLPQLAVFINSVHSADGIRQVRAFVYLLLCHIKAELDYVGDIIVRDII